MYTITEGEKLFDSMVNHKLVLHYNLDNFIALLGKVIFFLLI